MQIHGVVEIGPEGSGEMPAALLAAAYRASASAVVMLVLNGTTPSRVDRLLDRVVRGDGTEVKGVVYVDARDEDAVVQAARAAQFVVVDSPDLRALLLSRGVATLQPSQWNRAI